ncbi:proton-conducting transporter membrane subunit [Solidesulfovibrio sp.]|uniref:proton-conducting transporter transmembrane domain-containing protein n=1 Tax=Solidesulfovibrio sp. TaxID=2910990 RepID=UPI0026286738|nr:proton-conducting transporter membrane subunit [Solidesulfovibrio sp.]
MELFGISLAFYALGAIAALCAGRGRLANALGAGAALAGSVVGLAAFAVAPASAVSQVVLPWGLPVGSLTLGLDPVSRLFLLPVSLLGAACAVCGAASLAGHDHDEAGHGGLGAHWCFFNLLLAGLSLVMAARDAVCFLVAWEIMSLAPFFLIGFHDDEVEVREAAWTYLVAAHLGAVCVLAFFAAFWAAAGTTGFDALAQAAADGRLAAPSALFLLALAGFGAKAGFFPLHVWLPEAHPAAPSHVSAMLSGAMISAGVYGLWRAVELLGPAPLWWGWTLCAVGLVSAAMGILQGLAQGNLKRLLAYSSVENMGLACLGLGLGLVGRGLDNPAVAVLGLAGAVFGVMNHAAFKGLLFLCAGEVLHAVGSVRIAHLGGLGKRMPVVGAAFFLASAGIAGLPPLAGFAAELLLALSLLAGLSLPGLLPRVAMAGALAVVAGVGGVALAAFAKAGGLSFLGAPRTPAAAKAPAPGPISRAGLLFLVAAVAAAAVFAPNLLGLAGPAALDFPGLDPAPARAVLAEAAGVLASVRAVGGVLVVLVVLLLVLRRRLVAANGARREPTWGCGYLAPTARMQYGPASFVEPAARVMGSAMGVTRRLDMDTGYFPARARFTVTAPDRLRLAFFTPLFEAVARACDAAKVVQHGRVHLYILYVLATVVLLLAWKL